MKPGISDYRTWRDIAYSTIPQDHWMSRVTWHAQRISDEAKEAKRKLERDQAYFEAVATVARENQQHEAAHFTLQPA